MQFLLTLLVGFFVGLLARLLMPGRGAEGFVYPTFLGIIGAFLGLLVGQGLELDRFGEGAKLYMSALGALVIRVNFKKLVRVPSAD